MVRSSHVAGVREGATSPGALAVTWPAPAWGDELALTAPHPGVAVTRAAPRTLPSRAGHRAGSLLVKRGRRKWWGTLVRWLLGVLVCGSG